VQACWRIDVNGIVQGVGFRPFIYRLAKRFRLKGSVANNAAGVRIEIDTTAEKALRFKEAVEREAPPLAQITNITTIRKKLAGYSDFSIIDSDQSNSVNTLISPDIATCPACIAELLDPGNRRYLYPFINCTNCGPRFTLVVKVPYDRPYTSMASFIMCPDCQKEYDDPANRRFHAQPNACPVCGPRLLLYNAEGKLLHANILDTVIAALRSGKIVAIKGLGGFHLAVDAKNEKAVLRLRQRKYRFEKPLAVMIANITIAKQLVKINSEEEKYLGNAIRPIVLCCKREKSSASPSLSIDNNDLGIMLPYTPLHEVLFKTGWFDALVMTSANISEEPICYQNEECIRRLSGIADLFLMHNRNIYTRCDDSVLRVYRGQPLLIRRSRGYAPRPIIIQKSGTQLLAVGAQLKNTIALTKNNRLFLSQHIGDLENLETLAFFEYTVTHLKNLLKIEPRMVLFDKHPEYLSTKWVKEMIKIPSIGVQHHYAHILSVMAEKNLTKPVIGIALDGTGYGEDGAIWGGEVLICDIKTFRRFAHLEYIPMPGGERAIWEPWRMAVAYLKQYLPDWETIAEELFPAHSHKVKIIGQQIDKKVNTPLTSSCGRLFDVVAALLNLSTEVTYEGQAAIKLESCAAKRSRKKDGVMGSFRFSKENEILIITAQDVIKQVVALRNDGCSVAQISRMFHDALVEMCIQVIETASKETGIKQVILSGGCFQNIGLLSNLDQRLAECGYEVRFNQIVPVNDGGISLGQAYWGMYNYQTVIK
jgi:hydrogenase maturation protein HypF